MRRLRILVVDSETRYSVGGSLCRGFQALGHDATSFDQTPYLGGWVKESRWRRLAHTAVRPLGTAAMNLALLSTVFARKPDLVLVMKGYHVLPETLEAMRREVRHLISYHTDDLENPLNTSEAMRRSIPLWDVLFTPRRFVGAELAAHGVRRWEPLAFGYDPQLSHPVSAPPLEPVDDAVVFVGTWTPDRVELFERLAARAPLRVWGGGWNRVESSSPLSPSLRRTQMLGDALCSVIMHAGMNLGLLRKQNRDRHTMRTFEIPACAGFLLAERSDEHLELFEEGKEAVFFEGTDELLQQVERYRVDSQQRRAIAEAGYRRVTAGGHRYQDRAARMLEVVSEL